MYIIFFFFQAEDGIRDYKVTGVQTCALPISGAYLCLMHMRGEPRTMQLDPRYDDVAAEVAAFLEERLRFAVDAGIREDRICLDPGIGFGKTVEQNLELVRRLDVLTA